MTFNFILLCIFSGIMVNFISYPVINAFTSAAAITIAFGQVKGILGLKDIPREFLHMVYETFAKIPETRSDRELFDFDFKIFNCFCKIGLKRNLGVCEIFDTKNVQI